jgi:hypothetical protein
MGVLNECARCDKFIPIGLLLCTACYRYSLGNKPDAPAVEIARPSYYTVPGMQAGWDCNDISRHMTDLFGWGADQKDILKYLIRSGRKPGSPRLQDMKKVQAVVNAHVRWYEAKEESEAPND